MQGEQVTKTGKDAGPGHRERPSLSTDAERLVLDVLAEHADSLLRLARSESICLDDAHDAYQRALEIFLRHAGRIDRLGANAWLRSVVRNEARAVRKSRLAALGGGSEALEAASPAAPVDTPEERLVSTDRASRAAEALKSLKADQLRAIWLRALGLSYEEICSETGWSRTKVNRCLSEGRTALFDRYAGIESGAECDRWRPVLSAIVDGEAASADLLAVRRHLRNCGACRATLKELSDSDAAFRIVLPVGALALATRAASLVERVLPGAAGADAVLAAGGIGSAATAITKTVAVLAVTAASVTVAAGGPPAEATASPEPTRSLSSREITHDPPVVRSVTPGHARTTTVRREPRAGQPVTPGGVTAGDRVAATAAREFVPPRQPEASLPPRTLEQDEFTP